MLRLLLLASLPLIWPVLRPSGQQITSLNMTRLSQKCLKTKLPVHVADDPLHAVAKGTAIALKNIDRFPFLMRN